MSVLLRRYCQLLHNFNGENLNSITVRTIIDAFGDKGGDNVVKAANIYLNNIAATDPSKARAIAGLINEDPMMVCCLGLQPQGVDMPKRWLVGDGVAYIETGVNLSILSSPSVSLYFRYIQNGGSYDTIFGGWYSNTINTGIWVNNNYIHSRWGTNSGTTYSIAPCLVGTEHLIYADMEKFQYDNNTIYTNISKITYNGHNPIFATYRSAYYEKFGKFNFSHIKINDGTTPIRDMLPFIRHGVNGMIDIITGTFYPNANTTGTFTIEYILPDNTPWTPAN